jgi:hypothetical protein
MQLAGQANQNYGFYRYNWQYINPAALNYEYFHRKQNVNGTWYSPRQLTTNSTYRSQAIAAKEERRSMTVHAEYVPNLSSTQRNRPNSFRFKAGGGILDDTWELSRSLTAYGSVAGGIRFGESLKLIIGVNGAYSWQQVHFGNYRFIDPAEVKELQNELPEPQVTIIPGVLLTDFKKFYVGISHLRGLSSEHRQFHALFGWNFLNERTRMVIRRSSQDVIPTLIKSLTYDSGLSCWIRYADGLYYDNLFGKKSPISAMFNFRGQLLQLARNPVWYNVGINTAQQFHSEIGYTHFAGSEYGIHRTYGMDIDWHFGIGWDMPYGKRTPLGSSIEVNFGFSF